MNIHNIDQIVSIYIIKKEPYFWLEYQRERKFLGIRWQQEGFKDSISSSVYSAEDINNGKYPDNNIYVEGKEVYYYPHITVKFSNLTEKIYWFKNEDELTEWYNDNLKGKIRELKG